MSKTTPQQVNQLFLEKIASSCLDKKDAAALGFEHFMSAREKFKDQPHFHDSPVLLIPYYSADGKRTTFYRIRYLSSTKTGIAAQTSAKDQRYNQPKDLPPEVYLPKNLPTGATWRSIFKDPKTPLYFTEGELKSACATKFGLYTMGLGGVWNFKSKRQGWRLLPIFDEIVLKNRDIFIVFDSDAAEKPEVLQAQYQFCVELTRRGARPYTVALPRPTDDAKKNGIDDYILKYGIEAYKEVLRYDDSCKSPCVVPFKNAIELFRMNTRLAVVVEPAAVLDYDSGQLLNRNNAAMLYANWQMMLQKINASGDLVMREVQTFEEWLRWPQRAQVRRMVYEPGKPAFVQAEDGYGYNTWSGWGAEPEKGDVTLWRWLFDNVLRGATPEHKRWFEQWLAYPLQNPGIKMYTAAVFFGRTKGTGKSLLGYTVMKIYGENSKEIDNDELEDPRNVFAVNRQFIMGSEVTGSDKRSVSDRLKNLITRESITINKKYVPDYTIRDTINYYFTSNHADAIFMDNDERRYFVHEVQGERLTDIDAARVRAYDAWLRSGAAARALFYYLLRVDLSGFDPYAPAPDTASKRNMVMASMSELETWCHKLREDPDTCLRVNNVVCARSLFRVKDLVAFYSPDTFKRPSEKALSNALARAGFKKAARGESIPTADGKINLWIVRNEDALLGLSSKAVGKWYDDETQSAEKVKKFVKR